MIKFQVGDRVSVEGVVESVQPVGESGIRYTYLGEDLFGATTRQKVHERSSLTVDEEPDIWREVPVEELEREAQA